MKLRVTTDLAGDELVKALAATASAHGIEHDLVLTLAKSQRTDVFDLLDWQTQLRKLSGVGEDTWASPELQQIEDSMVKYAVGFAGAWLKEIRPAVRRLLRDPSEVTYRDFLHVSDSPVVDVDNVVQPLVLVNRIAHDEYTHNMRVTPEQETPEWVHVPKPIPTQVPAPRKHAEWLARQSAASKMKEWAEGMREDVRWQVVQAIRDGASAELLEKRLAEKWKDTGAHLRTIAATELAIAYNDASLVLLAGKHVVVPPIGDDKVCKSCKRWLEGKVFYVSPNPIDAPNKQQNEQYLWVGKSNIGRKQADWVPCLPLHPNCRHVAVQYKGGDPYDYRAVGTSRRGG